MTERIVEPADGGVQVSCPECGAAATIRAGQRSSEDFCPACDYPLFWAQVRPVSRVEPVSSDALYRAPGAAGSLAPSTVACPACGEHNLPTDATCARCGADLYPTAPAPPPSPPAPEPVVVTPPPVLACRHLPSWVVATMSAITTLALTTTALWYWG